YHLATITESLYSRPDSGLFGNHPTTQKTPVDIAALQKSALGDVLSLVKAALSQIDGPAPVLQVHEATQTLIFKGTPEQRAALEDVLDALDPLRGSDRAVVRTREDSGPRKAVEEA